MTEIHYRVHFHETWKGSQRERERERERERIEVRQGRSDNGGDETY